MATTDEVGDEVSCDSEEENDGYHDQPAGNELTPEEKEKRNQWEREQTFLKSQLITADSPEVHSWKVGHDPFAKLKYIGGVDISFVKGKDDACAMLVVLSYPELKVLHVTKAMVTMTEPYIPGFLAFREVGFLLNCLEELKEEKPVLVPQVVLVDGNGILHPRGFGLASHLGVECSLPCVGVAKNLFHVDGLKRDNEYKEKVSKKLLKKGDHFDLRGDSGKVWGRALRTSDDAPNPVFVSVGHKISLDTATQLVVACSIKRIPEPTRKADLLSRSDLREPVKSKKKGK